MKLEEITESLDRLRRAWGVEHQAVLDLITEDPAVSRVIGKFMEESIIRASTLSGGKGNPAIAVRRALQLASVANFRLGLLVGIKLYAPETSPKEPAPIEQKQPETVLLPDPIATPCPQCLGRGEVCLRCGYVAAECSCGTDYSPVNCELCNGKGEL